MTAATDHDRMHRALELAASVRAVSPPNPWVGCVIEATDGARFEGATHAVGGPHAEAAALAAAGDHDLRGATAWVTLEPCAHHGRTPPCADALVDAGIGRVVVAVEDPNPAGGGSRHRAPGRRRRPRRGRLSVPTRARRCWLPTSTTAAPAGPSSS